jgi:signal transduction histidine kinase
LIRKKASFSLILLLCILSSGISAVIAEPDEKERSTILTAEKTSETITIDGNAIEGSWVNTGQLVIAARDRITGTVDVTLKALYDEDYIYIYATWPDPTENDIREMWIYGEEQGWQAWSEAGTEMAKDEDRLLFMWNIDDSIEGFNVAGCAITCHGDRHHTNADGERTDIWQWRASTTNPEGFVEDKYWDNTVKEGTDDEAKGAGRHNDDVTTVGYSGQDITPGSLGYTRNIKDLSIDGTSIQAPRYYEPNPKDELDAKFLFLGEIERGEALAVTAESSIEEGTVVPGYILETPVGSRADIEAKGVWLDGRWHVEIKRELDTENHDDIKFDIKKIYRFGAAVTDNAAGFQSYGRGHSFDVHVRTLEFGGVGSEEISQLVLVDGYLINAKAYLNSQEMGLAVSEINHALTLYNEIKEDVAEIDPALHIRITEHFIEAKRNPTIENIDELIINVDDAVLTFHGQRKPQKAGMYLQLLVIWGKLQLYVFILLAMFAVYPLYKTTQVGRGPELRRMSIFLAIAIAPMIFEGMGRIGIYTKSSFLQSFSFMTNEGASLLWAMWMFVALVIARSGFAEINITINSLKDMRTLLEKKVAERTEKLESSNNLKDLFIDIMRHDLLGTIGLIENSTGLMLDGETDSEKRELIRIANEGADKLIELIENASKYADLESLESVDIQLFAIDKLLKETGETLEPLAIEKNIKIEYRTGKDCVFKASPLIKEVFWNLLSNAIKYSPENSKVILQIRKGPPCVISVTDNGPGIPDAEKLRIFERFARIKKGGVRGSGLGLAIVKRIVDLHEGKVWVEDNPEGGSTFKVVLPK